MLWSVSNDVESSIILKYQCYISALTVEDIRTISVLDDACRLLFADGDDNVNSRRQCIGHGEYVCC